MSLKINIEFAKSVQEVFGVSTERIEKFVQKKIGELVKENGTFKRFYVKARKNGKKAARLEVTSEAPDAARCVAEVINLTDAPPADKAKPAPKPAKKKRSSVCLKIRGLMLDQFADTGVLPSKDETQEMAKAANLPTTENTVEIVFYETSQTLKAIVVAGMKLVKE